MTILVGALPICATAPSPRRTLTEPSALESCTSPSSTMSEVLPAPSTVIVQSVPRIAAAAAGVSMVRPMPPRSARAQIVPPSRPKRLSEERPTAFTTRVVLRASLTCVWSANRTARLPCALVLSMSPARRSCFTSTKRQEETSMKRTSSPDLRAMTEPSLRPTRGTTSAAAGRGHASANRANRSGPTRRIVNRTDSPPGDIPVCERSVPDGSICRKPK